MTTSAVLSPGIKSLHLSLDTPVDPITGKVRRDLSGIRVWYSTQSGFNPANSQGTLAFNGLSLDITISNLLENTQYYVKYAFVSSIDPSVYTISQQLSALTYDENTTVYGNLTNPSSIIPTNAAGTDGNYTVAGGVFKVYKYSTEVTGTGVEYAIQSGTAVGGLVATLNPTTGAYAVTALTADYGSVILSATYDNVTILTTLSVTKARAGVDGTNAQLLTINAEGTAFVFKDAAASTSDTTKLTLIANLKNVTGTVTWTATAFNVNNVSLGAIAFTQTGNSIDITAQQFNPVAYNNTVAYVTVTASRVLLTDTVTLYRINNGTDQIVVEFTNESHTIPAYYDGTTVPASYIGSGTEIRVKQGNQYLTVDNTVPYATGTWTVTAANGVDITPDTTPGIFSGYINYDTHSNMTQDRAYIDYTITGTSLTGAPFSIGRRQSFAKSVAGEPGATATLVRLTTTELVFIKFKDGTFSSNSVTIYANPQNIPDPIFLWDDGINTPVPQDGSIDPEASQFEFTRPSELGVYTITVSVSDKFNTMLTQATDSISIAFIEEGSDAYTFLFKEPSNQLSANSLGIIEGGVTSNTNHIIGAQGIRLLVPGTVAVPGNDIVYTIDSTENCTAVLGSVTGTWNQQFTVSGAFFTDSSITSAKVTIKCQVPGGLAYYMTTSYIKVRKGDTGAAGASAIFADLLSEADVVTTLSDGTGYNLPTGNALRLYSGGSVVTTGVTYGGTITKNGLTLTIDNTGAITLSGAAWTNDQQLFNVTATLGGIAYTAVYTIAKSRAGSDAVFVDLLSEAEVVVTTSTGTGYTLPTGNSMRVFKGGAQVLSGVSYTGTTTKNGLTLTIDGSTGAITLSGAAWTTDKETFTLTATFAGVAYTYTYKITKAKQGTAGANGTNGTNGTRTAVLDVYIWSASAPTTFPSGTSTYTWSTAQFTAPATLNGWSLTPPSPVVGQTLWIARTVFADSGTSATSSITWNATTALAAGASGVNGQRVGYLEVYRWAATAPTTYPSGTSTYTWSTGAFTAPSTANGWSLTPGASTPGWVLWGISVAVSDTLTTATSTATWNSTTVYAVGAAGTNGANGATGPQGPAGANGANGVNGAAAPKTTSGYIYYAISGGDPGTPSASGFNFTTGAFTGLSANWGTTITMTGNGTYWASRYVVTESSAGSNTGTPSFSAAFTHQNFSGLVTFTAQSNALSGYATQTYASNQATTAASNAVSNRPTYFELQTQGYTTIHGGNISTGTLTADKIANGNYGKPAIYGGINTFGFGTGTIAGGTIATVGYFSTTDSGTLGLGVLSSQNVAFVASTVWSGFAGGFGNRWGVGINDIATANNRTLAQFCSNTVAGNFYHRDTNHTVDLATSSYAINASGPVRILGSLTVNGVDINTNGGTGYGPGSSPQFDQITASGRIFSASINVGGASGYTGDIYVGDIACGGNFRALGGALLNGNVYANYFYSQGTFVGSSRRIKDNILPIDIGLNFILSLEPVKYTLKSNQEAKLGFIAEDFPDARFVHDGFIDPANESKGKQINGIDYSSIVAPLVKAVQELNAKIVQLTTELNALKNA
jgi:hypothetical protein